MKVLNWLLIAVGVLFTGALALLSVLIWWMSFGVFGVDQFDSVAWSKPRGDSDFSCYRGGMAEDVKENVLKPGMTRERVVDVLGRPDTSDDELVLEYALGMCSGLGIDVDKLHIYFDPNDQFSAAMIRQH